MVSVKSFFTYEEQLEKMKSRGCHIDNESECLEILKKVSYYRLSAYFLPFRNDMEMYVEGTTFLRVYNIYEFDRKLRNLIFSAIESVEIGLRAKLSYYHAETYGPLGYLKAETFNERHDAEKFADTLAREIDNNSKSPFVKHHLERYGGQFPLWVASELFTFGMLSYFYNDLKTADKKKIAGIHYKEMTSWLRCCTDLRNICAHYGRVYNRIFTAIPKGFDLEPEQERKLWGAVKALKALYLDSDKWISEFVTPLSALLDTYKEDICFSHIGFPDDWYDQLTETFL